jgi:hypothetical protein
MSENPDDLPEDTLPTAQGFEPPQPNAADTNQIEVSVLQAGRRQDQEKLDLTAILTSVHGRRFVYRLLEICDMLSIADSDPIMIQRAEGRRWVGAEILKILASHSLATYPELLLERAAQAKIDEQERQVALHKRTKDQENVD